VLDLKKATESNFTKPLSSQPQSKYLGLIEYQKAVEIQLEARELVLKNPEQIIILGCEHPTVITLGRRADLTANMGSSDHQIPILNSGRGGLATLHSPGQLAIYPILHLAANELSVKSYVQCLLETTKLTFCDLGLKAYVDFDKAGVFTSAGKIAFCGVEIKNRISMHGVSLNISNDLALFDHIIPCGYAEQTMDRVDFHVPVAHQEEILRLWSRIFLEQLKKS